MSISFRIDGSPYGRSFWIASAVLVVAALTLAYSLTGLIQSEEVDDRRRSAVTQVGELLSSLKDAETAGRGYVITGDAEFLEPYELAVPAQAQLQTNMLVGFQILGEGLPARRIIELSQQRLALIGNIVTLARSGDREGAAQLVRSGDGKAVMDQIRQEVTTVQARLNRAISLSGQQQRWWQIIVPTLILLASLMLTIWLARRATVRQQAAEFARAQLQGVMANSPAGLLLVDSALRVRELNPAAAHMAQAETGALMGRHIRDFPVLSDWPRLVPTLRSVIDQGAVVADVEIDGSGLGVENHRFISANFFPVIAPNGRVQGAGVVFSDVTSRKQAELALAAAKVAAEVANKAKSQFLANMSHELRTPLSAVIGYSEMLEEEVAELGHDGVLQDLGKIGSNARHLLSLINTVLDLSKIEAGRMEVNAETFRVSELAREAAATVKGLMGRRGNTLEVACPPDLGSMRSDPVKVRQCLFNLLSNASKFTENGTVTLAVTRHQNGVDRVIFSVSDTGIGMTPEQQTKLFQPFSQVDDATTRKFEGTGLGLSITRAFAELLGGEVSVESEAAKGSTFRLELPVEVPEHAAPDGEEATQAADTALSPQEEGRDLVVVIDDDPSARDLLARFLARQGYAVRLAADGETGLKLVRALRPAVVLCDVEMPRVGGWTVLSTLKDDPDLATIPVIMVTVVQERALGLALGADAYLNKPVEWPRLNAVLQRYRKDSDQQTALIVSTDMEMRYFIRQLLSGDQWRVHMASTVEDAIDRMQGTAVDLALVDIELGDNGFTAVRQLKRKLENPQVVALAPNTLSDADRSRLQDLAGQVVDKNDDWERELIEEIEHVVKARTPSLSQPAHDTPQL